MTTCLGLIQRQYNWLRTIFTFYFSFALLSQVDIKGNLPVFYAEHNGQGVACPINYHSREDIIIISIVNKIGK